jgi:hypothetical protein
MNQTSVIISGFSNGAFLSEMFIQESNYESWISGIISIGGHQYGFDPLTRHGVPVMTHHGTNDISVNISGCCQDPSRKSCCCRISEFSPQQCVSLDTIFNRWLEMNNCTETSQPELDARMPSECVSGIGCRHPTAMCTYPGGAHGILFRQLLIQAPDLITRFIRQVVCIDRGDWIDNKCSCHNDKFEGAHCLTRKSAIVDSQKTAVYMSFVAVLLSVGVVVLICRTQMQSIIRSRPMMMEAGYARTELNLKQADRSGEAESETEFPLLNDTK